MVNFLPNRYNLARMKALLDAGTSVRDISNDLNCDITTVYKWRGRFHAAGPGNAYVVCDAREFNVGQKSLNEVQINQIQQVLEGSPFEPMTQIKNQLGLNCHIRTLRKTVHESLNIHNYKAAEKPAKPTDFELRLQFAINHLNIPVESWQKTIYMDEKVFSTNKDGRVSSNFDYE